MRSFLFILLFAILLIPACRPQDVEVTIKYEKRPVNAFPYIYYGETATLYYTVSGQHFEKKVNMNQTIKIIVPEKIQIRATFDKFVSDANGSRNTLEDAFYVVKSSNPEFIIK
ncbi:MAG: hypothetical protein HY964_05005 [Ignavibacteriales bacterium]|nr:hypothetical protein [Ignavibacteriales bacterium]